MTGFGMGESNINNVISKVEIKTVNNRYCDIKVKSPLQSLEILQRIEDIVQKKINRGSINILIKIDNCNDKINNIQLNEELLESYYRSLQELRNITKIKEEISLDSLIRLKEIFEFQREEDDYEETWNVIKISLEKALNSLLKSREEEGKKLMEDILKRLEKMKVFIEEIEKEKENCIKDYREKIIQKIEQISKGIVMDDGRLEMEVAILAQKSDISEEITRLKCHISQLKRISKNIAPIGRKIEFFTQEMGREINTIGSKSNHKDIQTRVIRLKAELEKIKEQSRNIE